MLAERGIDVSYETIRRWIFEFSPTIAAKVRSRRVQPSGTWHLAEIFVRIGGTRTYLWRAVDDEGEVLEGLAQSRRNKPAALKLMRKLLKKQGYVPDEIVTDKLGSYSAALRELGLSHLHVTGGRLNNRAEVSLPLPGSGLFAKLGEGADAPTRTPNVPVQIGRINATGLFCPRRYLQPFQSATPSDLSTISPSNPRQGIR